MGAPGTTPYTAAKHGILVITRTVALEVATADIRITAIAPATVDTPLGVTLLGNPDPFADAVLWLASDRSSYVTLVIDPAATTAACWYASK